MACKTFNRGELELRECASRGPRSAAVLSSLLLTGPVSTAPDPELQVPMISVGYVWA